MQQYVDLQYNQFLILATGQHEIIGPKGGRTGKELTVVKVERMPPTLKKGRRYIIIDPTKH